MSWSRWGPRVGSPAPGPALAGLGWHSGALSSVLKCCWCWDPSTGHGVWRTNHLCLQWSLWLSSCWLLAMKYFHLVIENMTSDDQAMVVRGWRLTWLPGFSKLSSAGALMSGLLVPRCACEVMSIRMREQFHYYQCGKAIAHVEDKHKSVGWKLQYT